MGELILLHSFQQRQSLHVRCIASACARILYSSQGGHQKLVTANTAQAPCSAFSSAASSFRSAVTSSAPAAASFCAAGLVVFLRTNRWNYEVVLLEQHVVHTLALKQAI